VAISSTSDNHWPEIAYGDCSRIPMPVRSVTKKGQNACLVSIPTSTTKVIAMFKLGHHKLVAAMDCNFGMETAPDCRMRAAG